MKLTWGHGGGDIYPRHGRYYSRQEIYYSRRYLGDINRRYLFKTRKSEVEW
jgi:hypothetical protein